MTKYMFMVGGNLRQKENIPVRVVMSKASQAPFLAPSEAREIHEDAFPVNTRVRINGGILYGNRGQVSNLSTQPGYRYVRSGGVEVFISTRFLERI